MTIGILCTVVSASLAADETGHIQVKCQSGIQVFLDGTLKGITSDDVGGIILQDIPVGQHTIKVMKKGFQPQETTVVVTKNGVTVHEIRALVSSIRIKEEGESTQNKIELKVGSLQIQSLPVDCVINIPAIGLRDVRKSRDKWTAEGIAPGKYTASLTSNGKTLTCEVQIAENTQSRLMVNFLKGDIEDLTRDLTSVLLKPAKERASLGVKVAGSRGWAEVPAIAGCVVSRSFPPASVAGILPGDIITAVDTEKVTDYDSLISVLGKRKVGKSVLCAINRLGESQEIKVQLASSEETGTAIQKALRERPKRVIVTDVQKQQVGWTLRSQSTTQVFTGMTGYVLISAVEEGKAAWKCGLRPSDKVFFANGIRVNSEGDLWTIVGSNRVVILGGLFSEAIRKYADSKESHKESRNAFLVIPR